MYEFAEVHANLRKKEQREMMFISAQHLLFYRILLFLNIRLIPDIILSGRFTRSFKFLFAFNKHNQDVDESEFFYGEGFPCQILELHDVYFLYVACFNATSPDTYLVRIKQVGEGSGDEDSWFRHDPMSKIT